MQEALFTWQSLITLSGAALLVFLIVLYTGRIVETKWKWGTDLYAVAWGWIILIAANLAVGAGSYNDWRIYVLCFFNSFIVAAAAGKLRDKSVSESERSQSNNTETTEQA